MEPNNRNSKSEWRYVHIPLYLAYIFYDIRFSILADVLVRQWVTAKLVSSILVGVVLTIVTVKIYDRIIRLTENKISKYSLLAITFILSVYLFINLQNIGTLLIFNPWRGG